MPIGFLPEWAVRFIVTIPISSGAKKKAENAVAIYNEVQGFANTNKFNLNIRMKVSGYGIGFQMSF